MSASTAGLVMDVKHFAVHDGPGIRTTFFLKGCPLRCVWCHNPEGMTGGPQLAYYAHKCVGCGECVAVCEYGAHAVDAQGHHFNRALCVGCGACEPACLGEALKLFGREMSLEEAVEAALEDRAFFEQSGGGVTVSGGEPLLQADFCRQLLGALRAEGIHTAVDTCGAVPWAAFEAVLPVTDMFLFDVKHSDSASHEAVTGQGLDRIADNLRRLCGTGARVEIRMPLVPGVNDAEPTLRQIGLFLAPLNVERMKVLPYHAMARSKYEALGMKDTMPRVDSPTDADLARAVDLLRACGVNAVSGRD